VYVICCSHASAASIPPISTVVDVVVVVVVVVVNRSGDRNPISDLRNHATCPTICLVFIFINCDGNVCNGMMKHPNAKTYKKHKIG